VTENESGSVPAQSIAFNIPGAFRDLIVNGFDHENQMTVMRILVKPIEQRFPLRFQIFQFLFFTIQSDEHMGGLPIRVRRSSCR
jgi:hypothetical protein